MIFSADDIQGLPSLNFVENRDDLEQYVDLLRSLSEADLGLPNDLGEFVLARSDDAVYLDSGEPSSVFLDHGFVGAVDIAYTNGQIFSLSQVNNISLTNSDVAILVDPDYESTYSFNVEGDLNQSEIVIQSSKPINESLINYDSTSGHLIIGSAKFEFDPSFKDLKIVDSSGLVVNPTLDASDSFTDVENAFVQAPKAAPSITIENTVEADGLTETSIDLSSDLIISDYALDSYLQDVQDSKASISFDSVIGDYSSSFKAIPARLNIQIDSTEEMIFDSVLTDLEVSIEESTLRTSAQSTEMIEITDGSYVDAIVWGDDIDIISDFG